MDNELNFFVSVKMNGALPAGWKADDTATRFIAPNGDEYIPYISFERNEAANPEEYYPLDPGDIIAAGFDSMEIIEQETDVYPMQ